MRTPIEVWKTTEGVDEYGVPTSTQKLALKCPAALKEVSHNIIGDTTRSINYTLEVTVRFSKSLEGLNTSDYIIIDKVPYDIITPPGNNWRLNKYIRFHAVRRSK